MKLSDSRRLDLIDALNKAAHAIEPDITTRQSKIYAALKNLADLSITIGVEIAMQHRHTSLEPVYSGAQLIRYDDQPTSEAIRQAEELER